jgi:diguanylate cyclase (GGDEF)-like protein
MPRAAVLPTENETRPQLLRYALLVATAAVVAVAAATLFYPVSPTIAIDLPGVGRELRVLAGIGFWVAFGLTGALRARGLPGGVVVTFHMPFVVAGTILGGPVVGAWMGLLSQFELRELRSVSWFGVVANHAIIALAAMAGGLLGQGVGLLLGSGLPGGNAFATLGMGVGVAVGFTAVNLALVMPIVAIRGGVGLRGAVRSYDASLRSTIVAETVLAWLMATTYLSVAWWAPLACVALVLVVWQAHERMEKLRHDSKTGLFSPTGFMPLLEAARSSAAQAGRRHALLVIDLDEFGQINKDHGADVGDDVIIAVARRMKAAVRSTDLVGRDNTAGDEFVILLADVPNHEAAVALAWRIHAQVCQAVRVRGSELSVVVGASMGIAMIEPLETRTVKELQRLADQRMQYAKRNKLGVMEEDVPGATQSQE